jgi:hypothetical protein
MSRISLAVTLVFAVTVAAEARAYWPLGSFGYGSYYAPGMYAADTRVPYFALHPPVYYSYPVPRPYGYSPWAYPGWVPTPHVEALEPQTLVNPYYLDAPGSGAPSSSPTPAAPTQATPLGLHKQVSNRSAAPAKPLRIVNPHFVPVAGEAAH